MGLRGLLSLCEGLIYRGAAQPKALQPLGTDLPDHRSPGAQSHLRGHSGAPSQTSWGAALPIAHSWAALAVPASQGLSPPGKADTGVSHKVGGLSELTWLTQVCLLVCPHCHQFCLTL